MTHFMLFTQRTHNKPVQKQMIYKFTYFMLRYVGFIYELKEEDLSSPILVTAVTSFIQTPIQLFVHAIMIQETVFCHQSIASWQYCRACYFPVPSGN